MSGTNQALTGYALLLAYAIPIGLVVMMAALALRGRLARRRAEEAEAELERTAETVVGAVADRPIRSDGRAT